MQIVMFGKKKKERKIRRKSNLLSYAMFVFYKWNVSTNGKGN